MKELNVERVAREGSIIGWGIIYQILLFFKKEGVEK